MNPSPSSSSSEGEEAAVLEELRGPRGVRLRNCEANVGKLRYAFNALQVQALPAELRPPASGVRGRADDVLT